MNKKLNRLQDKAIKNSSSIKGGAFGRGDRDNNTPDNRADLL